MVEHEGYWWHLDEDSWLSCGFLCGQWVRYRCSQASLSTWQTWWAAAFRHTSGPVGSGQLHQQLDPGWVLITATLIGLRSRSSHKLTDTNTVTLFCPVGPLRSSLMNVISVYGKQAFITSSRLAARHTELHSSARIHTCVCVHIWSVANCLTFFPAFAVPSTQSGLGGHLLFWLPLEHLVFISFSDLSLCLLMSLSKCSPFQNYYAWISALPLRVGLHLSPITVLLKYTHRHSPHGPANCVVNELTCKPAFK